jgi:DNA recombination protein RmuC
MFSPDVLIFAAAALVVGVVLGAVLASVLGRPRTQAVVDAAVLRSQAESQGELAQARERARLLEAERRQDQQQFEALQAATESLRRDLQARSDELARALAEGAGRAEAVRQQADDISRLEDANREQAQRLARLAEDLGQAGQELARIKEQALRVTPLEHAVQAERDKQAQTARELASIREEAARLRSELENKSTQLLRAQGDLVQALQERDAARAQATEAEAHGRELASRMEAERAAQDGRLQDLEKAHAAMSDRFKVIAEQILEEKSAKFTEQNRQSLGQLLDPLKTQLTEFKGKVEQAYDQEGKERSALAEQVRNLITLNQTLSKEAHNLTQALKNESKTQGNWGELILQRVLEAAGLAKDIAYQPQASQQTEDGRRLQPDVVIKLPGERNLVVDSKVSLVAYEEYVSGPDEPARERALKRHLESVRGHIKGLSGKEYQKLYGLKSIDFVLMFVPIEPAFMTAVTADSELFMDAWDKNVLLVSPSTLLFVVRTVAHLWRQEDQSRNAMAIAKRGSELYDRLVDFVKDLEAVGGSLQDASKSYSNAHRRLSTGRGNVIRQAEMLRDLGVKPSKALPGALLDTALEEDGRPAESVPLALLKAAADAPAALLKAVADAPALGVLPIATSDIASSGAQLESSVGSGPANAL